jgi:hypothetical protein
MRATERKNPVLLLLFAFFVSGAAAAQDIPLTNWTVPPYTQSSSGGITMMTDATPPRVFIGVQPCRLVDTRAGSGFPTGFGGPSLSPGVPRSFDLDNGPCPGLPSGIDAYSLNVTVTTTAGPGHLVIFPQGGTQVDVSSINYVGGQTIANAVIVPAGTGGGVTVIAGVSGTNLLIDINGYFSDTLGGTGNFLELHNNVAGAPTAFFSNSSAATNSSAVFGLAGAGIPRPAYNAAGLRGEGALTGVLGISHSQGVAGSFVNGAGVEVAFGIMGHQVADPEPEITGDNVGVFGQTNDNTGGHAGVLGYAPASTGRIYGVRGVTGSVSMDAAGVRGTDGGGSVSISSDSAGVRGESVFNVGLLGIAGNSGCGVFGFSVPSFEGGTIGCGPGEGVVGTSVAAIGNTSFVEPHPSDPSVMLRYTSLHGNESGTYFRGRGKFQNGLAVIEVPEDFRIVTDPENLTVQITPIGGMATVGVLKMDLARIIAQSSRDLEFSYLVQGVRSAYKDSRPVARILKMLVPRSPDEPMPAYLPPAFRQRLISNGTYTADGKVNMETARRLGWDKIWEQRSRPAHEPAP